MDNLVEDLIEDAVLFYIENLPERIRRVDRDLAFEEIVEKTYQLDEQSRHNLASVLRADKAACLIAVTWVLTCRNKEPRLLDNDIRPCLTVDKVRYDLLNPGGVKELSRLYGYEPGSLYRVVGLEEAFSRYVGYDPEIADFINAFSIRHGCAPSKLEVQ